MQMEAALHTVCVSKCPLPPHTPPASRCGLINVQCESWEKPEQAEVSGASSGREWRLCFPRVWADSIRCCHSSRDVNTLLYSSNCAGHSAKTKHLNNSTMILELVWLFQLLNSPNLQKGTRKCGCVFFSSHSDWFRPPHRGGSRWVWDTRSRKRQKMSTRLTEFPSEPDGGRSVCVWPWVEVCWRCVCLARQKKKDPILINTSAVSFYYLYRN